MAKTKPPVLICYGEVLWDFLPDGLFPGGAPFNVAYHAHQLGLDVRLVSSVGRDLLGEELVRRLDGWGISTDLVSKHNGLPTGYVRATVAAGGDASYEIVQSVAWDQILVDEDVVRAAFKADAFVFGSLAQRSPFNQNAVRRVLEVLPAEALRVFDVNLRPPFDDLDLVRDRATQVQVLKVNAAEAARLAAGEDEKPGREEKDARKLASEFGNEIVCVTAGERGAGLLRGDQWHWEKGRKTPVTDTIGAGDAFVASLVTSLLEGRSSDGELLARACRLGEWVASQRGATPAYGPSTPR